MAFTGHNYSFKSKTPSKPYYSKILLPGRETPVRRNTASLERPCMSEKKDKRMLSNLFNFSLRSPSSCSSSRSNVRRAVSVRTLNDSAHRTNLADSHVSTMERALKILENRKRATHVVDDHVPESTLRTSKKTRVDQDETVPSAPNQNSVATTQKRVVNGTPKANEKVDANHSIRRRASYMPSHVLEAHVFGEKRSYPDESLASTDLDISGGPPSQKQCKSTYKVSPVNSVQSSTSETENKPPGSAPSSSGPQLAARGNSVAQFIANLESKSHPAQRSASRRGLKPFTGVVKHTNSQTNFESRIDRIRKMLFTANDVSKSSPVTLTNVTPVFSPVNVSSTTTPTSNATLIPELSTEKSTVSSPSQAPTTTPSFPPATTKGTPITTAPSFSFGSASSTSNSTPSFTFGSAPSSEPAKSTLSLGLAASSATPAPTASSEPAKSAAPSLNFAATTTTSAPSTDSAAPSEPAKTTPVFSFGSSKSVTSSEPAKTAPTFTFGSSSALASSDTRKAVTETRPETTPSVSFGAPGSTTTVETKTTPSFSFGAATTCTASDANKPSAPIFSIGATPAVSKPAAFSFGFSAASAATAVSKPAASFSFGSASGASSTASSVFGAKTTTVDAAKPATGFSFGGEASKTGASFTAPSFSLSTSKAAQTPVVEPAKTAAPSFSFGAQSVSSAASTASAAPAFSFGAGATTTAPSMFGAKTTSAAPSFSFAAKTTAPDTAPSFSFGPKASSAFGAPVAAASEAPKSTGFSFGASSAVTTTSSSIFGGSKLTGFGFGASANGASTAAPTFPFAATSTAMSTSSTSAPSFSFGATSTAVSTSSTSAPSFSFGAKTTESPFAPAATPSVTPFSFGVAPASKLSAFGTTSTSTVTFSTASTFGANSKQQPAAFQFGAKQGETTQLFSSQTQKAPTVVSAAPQPSLFGGTNLGSSSGLFNFGSTKASVEPTKPAAGLPSASQTQPFAFGSSKTEVSSASTAFSKPSTGFNFGTPQSTANKAPFSFDSGSKAPVFGSSSSGLFGAAKSGEQAGSAFPTFGAGGSNNSASASQPSMPIFGSSDNAFSINSNTPIAGRKKAVVRRRK